MNTACASTTTTTTTTNTNTAQQQQQQQQSAIAMAMAMKRDVSSSTTTTTDAVSDAKRQCIDAVIGNNNNNNNDDGPRVALVAVSDGTRLVVPRHVAIVMNTAKAALEDCDDNDNDNDNDNIGDHQDVAVVVELPISNGVTGEELALLVEYCTRYTAGPDGAATAARRAAADRAAADARKASKYRNEWHLKELGAAARKVVMEREDTPTSDTQWNDAFVGKLNKHMQIRMLMAAKYMFCDPLMNLMGSALAKPLANKTAKEVAEYFGVDADFSPEEQAEIDAEEQWCREAFVKF